MGKITACKDLEVIPIEPSTNSSAPQNSSSRGLLNNLSKPDSRKMSSLYLSDTTIIPRVQKYLEANISSDYIDINVMSDHLQRKYYRDYGKRKRSAFRGSVKKAYQVVMQNHGYNDMQTTSDELSNDSSVVENQHINVTDTSLNNQLLEMYGRAIQLPTPKPIGENELIDISSDDSDDTGVAKTPANGASQLSTRLNPLTNNGNKSTIHGNTAVVVGGNLPPFSHSNANPLQNLSQNPNLTLLQISERGKKRKAAGDKVTSPPQQETQSSSSGNNLNSTITNNNNSNPRNNNNNSSSLVNLQHVAKKKKTTGATKTVAASFSGKTCNNSPATVVVPDVKFSDLGGIDETLREICKLLLHIKHPEIYQKIGTTPPRGFLLHGPPGCGKTLLATAIAGELDVPLLKVAAPELVAGVSGESEERIRDMFEHAAQSAPCVLFIDEIDAITQNRQFAQKDMERRIVAQLLICLDDLNKNQTSTAQQVLIIGATNNPHALDPALRRAGRFDREVALGIPNLEARVAILRVLAAKLKISEDFDYEVLAKQTPGFVGADLVSLIREAAMAAVTRVFNELRDKRQLVNAIATVNNNKTTMTTPVIPSQACGDDETQLETDDIILSTTTDTDTDTMVTVVKTTTTITAAAVSIDSDGKKAHSDEDDNHLIIDEELTTKDSLKVIAAAAADDDDVVLETEPTTTVVVVLDDDVARGMTTTTTTTTMEKSVEEDENDSSAIVDVETTEVVTQTVQSNQQPLSALAETLHWLHNHQLLSDCDLDAISVTPDDFQLALKSVQPSAKREGFATVPDVTWGDVGSLTSVREELQFAILAPVKHAKQFAKLGLSTPTGILLCGPPGCGKTLLAKAISNEAGINFISVKGPELLNMYVGESERAVRLCFERARNSAPCVIFFDELDALCPKRSDSREGGSTMRVVNQMLTEMDGLESRKGVYLLAASNRPDIIDPAVLRPGRLDKILYVGLPSADDRVEILRTITKNGTRPLLSPDVDLSEIGKSDRCDGYTGADLTALVREAGVQALREVMLLGDSLEDDKPVLVNAEHFNRAGMKIRPSISEKDQAHYEKLRKIYSVKQLDVEEMELS